MGTVTQFPLLAEDRRPYLAGRVVHEAKLEPGEKATMLILPVIHIDRSDPPATKEVEVVPPSAEDPVLLITSDVAKPTKLSVPPELVFPGHQLIGDVQIHFMGTSSLVGFSISINTGEPVGTMEIMVPLASEKAGAYYAMHNCLMQIARTIVMLRKESDNMSDCIPRFEMIYEEMMRMLEKLKP